jgi:hypothetical protein
MFRKELLTLFGIVLGTFLVVGVLTFGAASRLERHSRAMAVDLLPSIIDASNAQLVGEENWARVHDLLKLGSAAERAPAIAYIQTNSADAFWRDYSKAANAQAGRGRMEELFTARRTYLDLREQFFKLVSGDQLKEAQRFLDQEVAPAYARVRALSRGLFQTSTQSGREHAEAVTRISRVSPPLFALLGVMIFGLGLVIGLRGAFSGLDLVSAFRRPNGRSHSDPSEQG